MVMLSPATDMALADFLKDHELIEAKVLEQATTQQEQNPQGVINHLLEQNSIKEQDIAGLLARFYGLKEQPTPAVLDPLPKGLNVEWICTHRLIPFELNGNTLSVAVADPQAMTQITPLKRTTGYSIRTFATTLSALEQALSATASAQKKAAPTQAEAPAPANTNQPHAPATSPAPANPAQARPEAGSDVIEAVDGIITNAIVLGVSDIHIEPGRTEARVRYRKDGVLQDMDEYTEFVTYNYSAVITRLKIMASLDISERRMPQDGAIVSDQSERTVDIRVSMLPTSHGERVVMRILDQGGSHFTLKNLGLSNANLGKLEHAMRSPQGMVLVTGPTGSGKSTLLYAMLKELNRPEVNILTAEGPVELDVEGIGQVQVKEDIGLTFAAALRSFLRQDPEVIMVGEIRDKETSDIAVKAALTGHLVLSTLHTNDAPSTITRLINMGLPPYLITSALTLVVAQRLARSICPDCKTEDTSVTPEVLQAIGFSEEESQTLKTFHGTGCDTCMQSGSSGRRAIHEALPITEAVRKAIFDGRSAEEIRHTAREEGFATMQDMGRDLIREGVISVAEYRRVLMLE